MALKRRHSEADLAAVEDESAMVTVWTATPPRTSKRRRVQGPASKAAQSSASSILPLLAKAQDVSLPLSTRSRALNRIEAHLLSSENPESRLEVVTDALAQIVNNVKNNARTHALSVLLAVSGLFEPQGPLTDKLIKLATNHLPSPMPRLHALSLRVLGWCWYPSEHLGLGLEAVGHRVLDGIANIDSRVRGASLEALITVMERGFPVPASFFREIQPCLQDDFEDVREKALTGVFYLGQAYGGNKLQGHDSGVTRLADESFATICDGVNDLSPAVRVHAFELLGKLKGVKRDYLLQTLDKKVMSHLRKKKTEHEHLKQQAGRLDAVPAGDVDVQDMKLMNSGACGAFVHGLEDERYEVRLAAIFAIQALSATSTAFAIRSLDFLVDMFNDEIDQVRVAAITCLQHSGSSTVYYEEQLDTMLGVLDDASEPLRVSMHKLLAASKVANYTCLHAVVYALLLSIRKYPDDAASIHSCLKSLGRSHNKFAEFLVAELLNLDGHFAQVEPALDDTIYNGVIVFLANAALRNPSIMTLFPVYAQEHCRILHDQLPLLIPELDFSQINKPLSGGRLMSIGLDEFDGSAEDEGASLMRRTIEVVRSSLSSKRRGLEDALTLCQRNFTAVEKHYVALAATARFYKDLIAWHIPHRCHRDKLLATSSGQHKQKTGPSAYFLQFMYTGLSDAVVEHLVDMRCQEHVTQLLSLLLHPGPNGEAAIAESIKSLKDRTATARHPAFMTLTRALGGSSHRVNRPELIKMLQLAAKSFTAGHLLVSFELGRISAKLTAKVAGSKALLAGIPFEIKIEGQTSSLPSENVCVLVSFADGSQRVVSPPASAFRSTGLRKTALQLSVYVCHPAFSESCAIDFCIAVAFPLDTPRDPILNLHKHLVPHPSNHLMGLMKVSSVASVSVAPRRLRKQVI